MINDKGNKGTKSKSNNMKLQKVCLSSLIKGLKEKKDFLIFCGKQKDKAYVIYESALLFETQSNTIFDKIICVSAPLEVRINRVIMRDKITREETLQRVLNQMSQNKKILQSHYHIENIDLNTTRNHVDRIHNILTKTLT